MCTLYVFRHWSILFALQVLRLTMSQDQISSYLTRSYILQYYGCYVLCSTCSNITCIWNIHASNYQQLPIKNIYRDLRIRNNMEPRKEHHYIKQVQRIKVELMNLKVETVRMKMLTCQVMEILINQLRGIKTNSILCPQYLIE